MADLNISGDIQISPTSLTGSLHPTTINLSGDLDTGNGKDGYSPTVDVEVITGGHRITITDRDGAHTFDVVDGTVGVGISDISKTSTHDNEDTYTITYTDGSTTTFVVTNGEVTWNDVGNIAVVSHTQPSSSHNVIWIEDEGTTIELPTMEEFEEVADDVSDLKAEINQLQNDKADIIISNASGTVASFSDGAEYDAVGLTAEFAPYQEGSGDASPENIRPIHGWTGLDIFAKGKNLVNVIQDNVVYANLGRNVSYTIENHEINFHVETEGSNFVVIKAFKILPFMLGMQFSFNNNEKNVNDFVLSCSEDGQNRTGIVNGIITEEHVGKWLGCRITRQQVGDYIVKDIQLEIGLVSTPYEPYNGTTTPISWQTEAGEVFGGYVDAVRGKLVAEWQSIILNGTQPINLTNWRPTTGTSAWLMSKSIAQPKTYSVPICDRMVGNNYSSIYNGSVGITTVPGQDHSFAIRVAVEGLTTESAINAWLASNPLQVCYELETPIEYDITPATIELLKGYNNVWTNVGGNVDVTYRADTKLYIDGKQLDIRNTIAPIEDGATASQAYATGKFFYRNGSFCKAKTAIASGATFTLGTNYEVTTVAAELFTALS